MRKSFEKGIGLLEVVIGVTIVTGAVLASFIYYSTALRIAKSTNQEIQATLLAREGLEAVRSMRDSDWDAHIASVTTDTPFYLHFNGTSWSSTSTPESIDSFNRYVVFEEVDRDTNDDISSSGTTDPDFRKVTVSIEWQTRTGTSSKSLSTYLGNVFNE